VFSSEALRLQKRIQQIEKQQDGCDTSEQVVHVVSSKLFASFGQSPAGYEEQSANTDIKNVEHFSFLSPLVRRQRDVPVWLSIL
jgi:hypothetical protein